MTEPRGVIDELAQEAALGALRHSSLILFCVDASRGGRGGEVDDDFWREDMELWSLVQGLGSTEILTVATKCDIVSAEEIDERLAVLGEPYGVEFVGVSSESGAGIDSLRAIIDDKLLGGRTGVQGQTVLSDGDGGAVGLTARHRQVVGSAIENAGQAAEQLGLGNDELAAMLLRAAYEELGEIDRPGAGHVDERILDEIFGRFCIGK
jgi:tRNA U34 5-carboxymethylaminomethyl modifying GTPase MnmE/TrmE